MLIIFPLFISCKLCCLMPIWYNIRHDNNTFLMWRLWQHYIPLFNMYRIHNKLCYMLKYILTFWKCLCINLPYWICQYFKCLHSLQCSLCNMQWKRFILFDMLIYIFLIKQHMCKSLPYKLYGVNKWPFMHF